MSKDKIEKQIIKETQRSFSEKVEDLVWMKDISYLDAIAELTEEHGFEPQQVPKLLTPDLYNKLVIESENLFLIKKTRRLDI